MKKDKMSKKKIGRIRLVIFWIICICLIIFIINIPKMKKNGTLSLGSSNTAQVTDLENVAISNYIKGLHFNTIATIKQNNIYGETLDRIKMVFCQMEYLRPNPEADNDLEQMKAIYNTYFEPISDEDFANMYETDGALSVRNVANDGRGIDNIAGNDVLSGSSLYVKVEEIKKQNDIYTVKVKNVSQIDLSKLKSENSGITENEGLEVDYINYVNDSNIDNYISDSQEYTIKLKVDDGKIYIQEF